MRMRNYLWIGILIYSILANGLAYAISPSGYSGKMNTAVGGLVTQKVSKWGFASNDPRYSATMSGVGAGLTTLAVGSVGVAVGSATWPAVLVAAGISALVSGAVSLAQDSAYKWLFDSTGTISTSGSSVSSAWTDPAIGSSSCGTSAKYLSSSILFWCTGISQPPSNDGVFMCQKTVDAAVAACKADKNSSPVSTYLAKAGMTQSSSPSGGLTKVKPADAVADIPASEAAKPVSNELLAAAANAAWKAMANANSGFPWSASDPITPADVAAWKASNPDIVPTVGDAVSTVAASGSSSVVIPQQGAGSQTGPGTSEGTGTKIDLGPNPNVPFPTLESTPTANQILDPAFNLMPDIKNFAVPSHTSTCPKPSFTVFGKAYSVSSHCGLIDDNRSVIEAAMLLVWSITALFIVLRA